MAIQFGENRDLVVPDIHIGGIEKERLIKDRERREELALCPQLLSPPYEIRQWLHWRTPSHMDEAMALDAECT
jgi:hypothetical protein